MVFHLHGEGFQRVSLSPSDSCQWKLMRCPPETVGRFPVDTPITPPAIGLTHTQFCDKIKGKPLPGDGPGRECFDTFPTFVVGDPSARFGGLALMLPLPMRPLERLDSPFGRIAPT